jgi:hypothetical protein
MANKLDSANTTLPQSQKVLLGNGQHEALSWTFKLEGLNILGTKLESLHNCLLFRQQGVIFSSRGQEGACPIEK